MSYSEIKKELSAGIQKIADYIRRTSEKSATIKIGKNKITFKPGKTLIAAVILVLILLVISVIAGMGTNTKEVKAEFEAGSSYSVKMVGDNAVMFNNKGGTVVNDNGKAVTTIECAMSQPVADSEGKYLILADLAGNHYSAAYKNGKLLHEFNTDNDIISAKITADGNAAIATDTDGYKACVTVYNSRGSELYTWNSGSGYITDIDITQNARYLAAAQLVTNENSGDTKIQFIDTRRDEVVCTVDRPGEIAAEIKFITDNKLLVVTDSHISGYNRNGKQLFDISLEGKTPSLYNVDSEDCMGVVVLDNRGNHVLEIYSYSGKLLGSYTGGSEIRALAMWDKTAAVVEQKGVVRINSRGKAKRVVKIPHDIKDICFFDSGRVFAVGSSEAETFNLK